MSKHKSQYVQVIDGEWEDVPRGKWHLACCDCGLVHEVKMRVVGKKLQMRLRRDERKTAALRREERKKNGN